LLIGCLSIAGLQRRAGRLLINHSLLPSLALPPQKEREEKITKEAIFSQRVEDPRASKVKINGFSNALLDASQIPNRVPLALGDASD